MSALRPYQARAVADLLSDLSSNPCLVAPTGAGKTRMLLAVVEGTVGRVLWVVHRRELVVQTLSVLVAAGLAHRVSVCTIQGLLASASRPEAELLLWDEVHHAAAETWSGLLEAYPTPPRVGATATPERRDGIALGGLFGRLVVAASYSELIADGHLVPCRVIRPDTRLRGGIATDPVSAYQTHTPDAAGFCYLPTIADARDAAARFVAAGIPAACVDAETPTDQRDAALADFARGELRILTNVYALTEGVDQPHAAVCILARGCTHVGPYLQMVGRVLRTAPGKTEATLLDLSGVSHEFGFPTDDRTYSLDGRAISIAAPSVTTCLLCGATYESGPDACPQCGFVAPSKDWKPVRIYSAALREAYKGAATHDDVKVSEYRRLRALARAKGWSVGWVVREYQRLFGLPPDLADVSHSERRHEYVRMREFGHSRGWKPGYAAARFHAMFGSWPPREFRE